MRSHERDQRRLGPGRSIQASIAREPPTHLIDDTLLRTDRIVLVERPAEMTHPSTGRGVFAEAERRSPCGRRGEVDDRDAAATYVSPEAHHLVDVSASPLRWRLTVLDVRQSRG